MGEVTYFASILVPVLVKSFLSDALRGAGGRKGEGRRGVAAVVFIFGLF